MKTGALDGVIKADILPDSGTDSDATGAIVAPYGGLERNIHPLIRERTLRFNHRNDSSRIPAVLSAATRLSKMEPRTRVLIIDDDTNFCLSTWDGLAQEGYEVRYATTGREGLKYFNTWSPNIIPLDQALPDIWEPRSTGRSKR